MSDPDAYEPPPEVPDGTYRERDSSTFLVALLYVMGGLTLIAWWFR